MHGIAANADTPACSLQLVAYSLVDSFINVCELLIKIFCSNSFINPPLLNLSDQSDTFIHSNRERLSATHSTEAGGYIQCPFQRSAKMFVGSSSIRLISSLHNSLAADIDPAT